MSGRNSVGQFRMRMIKDNPCLGIKLGSMQAERFELRLSKQLFRHTDDLYFSSQDWMLNIFSNFLFRVKARFEMHLLGC